tara:strand:+ start:5275 stop:8556 length:3282 start_codon:yes stop_codon:yes gene_type:complete
MPRKFDFVSPGILMNEVDESQLPPVVSDSLGPLIIGRALSGPAMKPIKVKSIDAFNEIFGKGISGKGGSDNDVWREGNTLGPTYGVYAAQAHLASQTTPVTFVRLLGEANPSADSNAEYAGWSVSTSANPNALPTSTNTAYGLFIIPSASYADGNNVGSGSLAAVFYTQGAALTLSGTIAGTTSTATSSAGTLINSIAGAANRFKMCLYTADTINGGTAPAAAEEFTFDLTPGSKEYIRDVFSTNPQILGNANKNFGLTDKKYFLGESYEVAVAGNTATTAGSQVGILLALDSGSLNWADHYKDMKPAKSGWFINRQPSQEKLFRVVALHDGEWLQNNYEINIRDLSLGNALVPNSTFTLEVTNKEGNVIEQYSGLNLDPSSESYISKVIGDQYLEWDSTNTKYNVRGEYGNNSDYIYIEVASAVKNQQLNDRHALPVGFYGPLRPKGFSLVYGSKGVNVLGDYDQTGAGVKATAQVVYVTDHPDAGAKLIFNHPNGLVYEIECLAGGGHSTSWEVNGAGFLWNIDNTVATTVGAYAVQVAIALNALAGYSAVNATSTVTIVADSAGSHWTFTWSESGDDSAKQAPGVVTAGTDTDDFANSFVLGNNVLACMGGDAEQFASLPHAYSASCAFPALRLTTANANSNGKHFAPTDLQGVRHHKGTSTRRDDSYIDICRVLPSNASNTLTHHLGETASPPDALEYSFVFSLDDICSGSSNANSYFFQSGSYTTGSTGNHSISGDTSFGLSKLFEKKVRQFRAPLFGGHNGLDLTEVEPFSNKNLADKTRLSSYAYNSIFKALETVEDAESVKYDLISIPGVTQTDVTDEVMGLASKRQDCLAIIDIPGGYKPGYENNGSVTTGDLNGTITNLEGRLINNSYAATYYPWIRLQDRIGGQGDVLFVPPSIAAIGALGKSQGMSELWFAPAGFNRGGINELGGPNGPIITGTWEHLTKADRDRLYQANINPIARFPSLNQIVIFGQKTLQQKSSALDRINVRRLLIYLKHRIGLVSETILFDQNVRTTWNRFKFKADAILSDTQSRLGISEYKLVLDDKTTTADLVDRNILYAKIFIKPTRSIEFIAVDFIISRSGVEF